MYPKYKPEAIEQSAFYSKNALGETKELVSSFGLRNSQLLTIAPTGSLSTMLMDNWFCGVDKKDKRAYLISFNEIDENVFEDRKIALKRIHNAEQKYPQVSGETYYEEY